VKKECYVSAFCFSFSFLLFSHILYLGKMGDTKRKCKVVKSAFFFFSCAVPNESLYFFSWNGEWFNFWLLVAAVASVTSTNLAGGMTSGKKRIRIMNHTTHTHTHACIPILHNGWWFYFMAWLVHLCIKNV